MKITDDILSKFQCKNLKGGNLKGKVSIFLLLTCGKIYWKFKGTQKSKYLIYPVVR